MKWNMLTHSFSLTYQDKDGAMRTTRKGLSVKYDDGFGNPLTEDQMTASVISQRAAAVAAWNKLDHSGHPRLELTDDSK